MPCIRESTRNYAVLDEKMRSTGKRGQRRYGSESHAINAAKEMLAAGNETTPLFVVKLISKVEAPQTACVTSIG